MFEIVSGPNPETLDELYSWFVAEWEKVEPFVRIKNGVNLPQPIIALENKSLAGGLSFTVYPTTDDTTRLWINALLVAPEKRRKGLGSDLIRKAMETASKHDFKEIFVLTDLPSLYTNLGWDILSNSEKGTILKALL